MSSFSSSDLKNKEYIVVKKSEQISKIVFPSSIQVGLANPGFNNGIVLPNLSSDPEETVNTLYAVDGDLYFNSNLMAKPGGISDSENTILASQIFG